MENLTDRLWQFAVIIFGGLVSLFMYRKKKEDDWKDLHDSRLGQVELNQAKYDVTVQNIHEDIREIKDLITSNKKQ